MGLFSNNTNTNVLISIEYTITLLSAGYSRENIIVNLGKKKFGRVSKLAKGITKGLEKKGYHESLTKEYEIERQPNLKRFISIMNSDDSIDISPMLNDLSYQIMKEKELTADNMIDNMTSGLQKTLIITALPMIIFFVILLQSAFPSVDVVPRPELDYLLYGVTVLLLMVIIVRMKYNES